LEYPTGEFKKEMTLGYTVLKTDDSHHIVVPNSVMASQAVIKALR
jgi:hypothetical protein